MKFVVERTGDDLATMDAVTDWFRRGMDVFGGRYQEHLFDVAARDSKPLRDVRLVCGEPRTPYGRFYVRRLVNEKVRVSSRVVARQSWAAFLEEKAVPSSVSLTVDILDRTGRIGMPEGGDPFLSMTMKVANADVEDLVPETLNRWILLSWNVPRWVFREDDVDDAVAAALREFSDAHSPVYGEVSCVGAVTTDFEEQFGLAFEDTVVECRHKLRGYSWLTVVSDEIGELLGGEGALVGSGAFREVARLRNGGYWLRATESLDGYGMTEAERVFRVVAPALPVGEPLPPAEHREPTMVVRANPAGYR